MVPIAVVRKPLTNREAGFAGNQANHNVPMFHLADYLVIGICHHRPLQAFADPGRTPMQYESWIPHTPLDIIFHPVA
jgi:hypothetical protein